MRPQAPGHSPRCARCLRRRVTNGVAPSDLSDFTLCKPEGLCYRRTCAQLAVVPGSSAVEQPAVNRLVAGSNPARGAKQNKRLARRALTPDRCGVRSGYNTILARFSRKAGIAEINYWLGSTDDATLQAAFLSIREPCSLPGPTPTSP